MPSTVVVMYINEAKLYTSNKQLHILLMHGESDQYMCNGNEYALQW